ncbi:MAG TPA: HEAT repeat domain-containing protein [Vicinamibacteria bacterium]|nr:HEAT repeat domain-containing protein [Vicinamibacteria bacterium]
MKQTVWRGSDLRGGVLGGAMFLLALPALDARGVVSAQTPAAAAVDDLASANPSVRRKAASDLGKSKAPDALPRLAALVRDPDVDVRVTVLRAIASLRDLAGVPSMVVFMADSQARVRSEAIDGAVEIYTHRDRPGMSRFLSIFSDGRDKPEPLLVSSVDFEVYRSLAALLKDSDLGVRESAAEAIGILGGTEVAADLARAASDSVPAVRAAAVTAIVKVGTSADGEALTPLIRDQSTTVRRRAIAGLGRLKVVDAAPDLRRYFEANSESEDGILALNSLAQIALPQDRALFQRLVLQPDPRKRRPGIEALARLNEKGNEARFKRDFQREKNEELRAAYAFAIFLFGDRPFIDTVVLGLAGTRDRARQARGYVEEIGARALPEALDYLREPDPKIRAGLCDALSTAGVTGALDAIEPLSRDKDPQVAAAALRARAILKRQR